MKKTLNINLAGYPFIIDDDAYNLLKDYLDTIRYAFKTSEDTAELAEDIEARVAEILIGNENGNVRIVSVAEISQVIERIGKPSDFIEIDEKATTEIEDEKVKEEEKFSEKTQQPTPPPYESTSFFKKFSKKRLFRDPQNSMLGGVCSGLSHYLNVDVTWVRIIVVLLFFLSASTVGIAYIILWIVVPEARTPYQRMQMMGENPTMENIGKTVTENFQKQDVEPSQNNTKDGVMGFFSLLLSVLTKCLIILGLLIGVPLLFALGVGLLGCVIASFIIGLSIFGVVTDATYGFFDSSLEGQFTFFILLAVIGGIITVGIPLWLLVRMAWKKKESNTSAATRRALLVVWLCGIALLSVFTVKGVEKWKKLKMYELTQRETSAPEWENSQSHEIEEVFETESDSETKPEVENSSMGISKIETINKNDTLISDSDIVNESVSDSIH